MQKFLNFIAAFLFEKFCDIFCFHALTNDRFIHAFERMKDFQQYNLCLFVQRVSAKFTVYLNFIK